MNKYNNGKIYGLYYEDKLIYIGSTILTMTARMRSHFKSIKSLKKGTSKLYIFLRENDLSKLTNELIEEYPCNSKKELLRREGEHQRKYTGLLNKEIAGRTKKEWRDENREINNSKNRIKYYEQIEYNKQRKKEYYSKKRDLLITCECGKVIREVSKGKHIKSLKHKKIIEAKL